jgi:spore germination cell wall hydrolase CwlJ-like protein
MNIVSALTSVLTFSASAVLKITGLAAMAVLIYGIVDQNNTVLDRNIKAMPAGYVSMTEKFKQLECLTRNIYWEAAGEPFEGKVAVAQVTMNRLKDGRFGNTVCEVVHSRNVVYQKVVCQFTWTCQNNHKIKPVHPGAWQESELIAQKVMLENFRLPSLDKALYFHADYVNPNWKKPRLTKIGRHIFYAEGHRS